MSRISMGKTIRRSSVGTWMGKRTKLGMSVCSSKTKVIFSVHVDDIKMTRNKQNSAPMWKKL